VGRGRHLAEEGARGEICSLAAAPLGPEPAAAEPLSPLPGRAGGQREGASPPAVNAGRGGSEEEEGCGQQRSKTHGLL
jgi:hypothetical protein